MKQDTKRITWAVALAMAACICTADTVTENGQGIWDAAGHSITASASAACSDDEDDDKDE